MKVKIGLMFLFFLGSLTIVAQDNINQLNSKGERVGVWKKYYPNGNIRYQGQFQSGKEVGVFNYYSISSSKKPIIVKTFSLKSSIASIVFYSETGILKSKGKMDGKNRIGKWQYFREDGKKILSEENYEHGKLNGISKTYYKTGKITEILNYKNNKLEGNIKRFADTGVLLDDLNYSKGKLNGLAKYYNSKGELRYTGMYKNDEKIGKWEYFEKEKSINPNKLKQ